MNLTRPFQDGLSVRYGCLSALVMFSFFAVGGVTTSMASPKRWTPSKRCTERTQHPSCFGFFQFVSARKDEDFSLPDCFPWSRLQTKRSTAQRRAYTISAPHEDHILPNKKEEIARKERLTGKQQRGSIRANHDAVPFTCFVSIFLFCSG